MRLPIPEARHGPAPARPAYTGAERSNDKGRMARCPMWPCHLVLMAGTALVDPGFTGAFIRVSGNLNARALAMLWNVGFLIALDPVQLKGREPVHPVAVG